MKRSDSAGPWRDMGKKEPDPYELDPANDISWTTETRLRRPEVIRPAEREFGFMQALRKLLEGTAR